MLFCLTCLFAGSIFLPRDIDREAELGRSFPTDGWSPVSILETAEDELVVVVVDAADFWFVLLLLKVVVVIVVLVDWVVAPLCWSPSLDELL